MCTEKKYRKACTPSTIIKSEMLGTYIHLQISVLVTLAQQGCAAQSHVSITKLTMNPPRRVYSNKSLTTHCRRKSCLQVVIPR